jgi:hypothetical protein
VSGGYVHCACRDCMEIAIQGDEADLALCHECEEAGCSAAGDEECSAPHADCDGGEDDEGNCNACGEAF